MEVHIETVAAGAVVTARIVLQGNSSITEISRLSLTRAQWEDFSRCLNGRPRVHNGKIVFAPTPRPELKCKVDERISVYRREAVA